MRKFAPYAASVAAVLGAIVGAGTVWVAFRENLNGDFLDQQTGAIDYKYGILLFLSWFVPVFVSVGLVEALVYLFGRAAKIWK